MARSEARIFASIWSDPDFRALSRDAQWAFMFLLSQPDLSYAGVLPLRIRRWAGSAAEMTVDILTGALRELETARFILVDGDTEELLIRTLIRGDEIYRQPNLVRAARKALNEVVSARVRAALLVEAQRCTAMAEKSAKAELEAFVEDLRKTLPNPSSNPSPNPSPNPLGERGMVTTVTTGFPLPLDPFPQPLPPTAGNSLTLAPHHTDPAVSPATTQDLLAEWLEHCRKRPPGNVIALVGKQVKTMLGEGIDPNDVRAGLAAWHQKGLNPSALPSVVNELMNASPTSARASPNGRPSTTDQRVAAALALADQLEREEAPP